MNLQLPAILCLAILFAANVQARPPVVAGPLAAYHRYLVSHHMESGVSVLKADFDCDGRLDVAITTISQGRSGADWLIYLRRPDDRFSQVGSVSTKANRFHIAQQKKGVGRLAVMQRAGPGEIVVMFYDLSHTALHKVRVEDARIPKEQTGMTRIDEIFGTGYSELPATSFTFAQLQNQVLQMIATSLRPWRSVSFVPDPAPPPVTNE